MHNSNWNVCLFISFVSLLSQFLQLPLYLRSARNQVSYDLQPRGRNQCSDQNLSQCIFWAQFGCKYSWLIRGIYTWTTKGSYRPIWYRIATTATLPLSLMWTIWSSTGNLYWNCYTMMEKRSSIAKTKSIICYVIWHAEVPKKRFN